MEWKNIIAILLVEWKVLNLDPSLLVEFIKNGIFSTPASPLRNNKSDSTPCPFKGCQEHERIRQGQS